MDIWSFFISFCNRRYSFLSFGEPQLYSECHYKLADKLGNFVTVCFCVSPGIFIQINNISKLPAPVIEPLTLGLQNQRFTPTQGKIFPFLHPKTRGNEFQKLAIWGTIFVDEKHPPSNCLPRPQNFDKYFPNTFFCRGSSLKSQKFE